MRVYTRVPLSVRFWAKVKISSEPDDCWEWTGGINPNGYGRIGSHKYGEQYSTHRLAYKLTHGEITDGLFVLHSCDNRKCCNPAHLFLGTHKDNVADMINKGRQRNQVKTHCKRGHPFDSTNTRIGRKGERYCHECCAAAVIRNRAKRRIAGAAVPGASLVTRQNLQIK